MLVWLVGYFGLLVCWLLIGCFIGLVGWLAGWLVSLVGWLAGWLVFWLVSWLVFWLVVCVHDPSIKLDAAHPVLLQLSYMIYTEAVMGSQHTI